ncbi:hypothetical protein H0H81_003039 [Sphagnurus paluster]|uniref:GPN-loop GTPase 3 n=1 Tax=Sphagnurus paluster TaxID=117069 RepID=A0A9P7FVG1_9AGAR|nr:hypothetical protein H0H81_003039 [Sphagnurus paluster]
MSAMVNLEIPWINIMSKMDLVTVNPDDPAGGARNGMRGRKNIARYPIEDHPLVSFLPLDLTNSDSLETVISHIDYTMQYGEDEEPKEPHDLDEGDFQEALE